jgi:very-short-patch-repair endonuclease
MHARVKEMAAAQDGLVTWAGLRACGLSVRESARVVAELRRLHDGVFLTGQGRVTDHQRRLAATLTAPATVLSSGSGGALHGFRAHRGAFEVVTRPGNGGPRRLGGLLVCYSSTLAGEVVTRDGIPVTSPTRTLVDLCAHLTETQRAKAVREGIRLAPQVNVRYAGEEADLSWPDLRHILEIDGPQFHRDPVEDARKEARWAAEGWTVGRVSSDVVFDEPAAFGALVATRTCRD